MTSPPFPFKVCLAKDENDLRAAQRLRYQVFVTELGADGPMVDHENQREVDEFDPVCDHLLLVDPNSDPDEQNHVAAVYRLLEGDKAREFGRFYCDSEYDLDPLRKSGRRLLELGRSCVRTDLRGGAAMPVMWGALADYVLQRNIEVMFGVASFHGTDPEPLKASLSWLHHNHLAAEDMRPRARECGFQRMDLLPADELQRSAAMAQMPNLIRAYLRLGGFVGDGAFLDHEFNTTDVMLLMDTALMSAKHLQFYSRRHEAKV